MSARCTGLAGLLLGHKFEPRHNLPPPIDLHDISSGAQVIFRDSGKGGLYQGDYCRRCGISAAQLHQPLIVVDQEPDMAVRITDWRK